MKYKRLVAEMFVKGITKGDLAKLLGKSREDIENKLNGKTDFSLSEAILVKNVYFKEFSMHYIFFNERGISRWVFRCF